MTSQPEILSSTPARNKINYKNRLLVFCILVIVILIGGAALFLKLTQTNRLKYQAGLQDIEKLQAEKVRCSQIISSGSGDFSDYEYCRKLIQVFSKE